MIKCGGTRNQDGGDLYREKKTKEKDRKNVEWHTKKKQEKEKSCGGTKERPLYVVRERETKNKSRGGNNNFLHYKERPQKYVSEA